MNLHRDRSKSAVSMDMSRIHQLAIHVNVWEIRALATCLANIHGYVTGSGGLHQPDSDMLGSAMNIHHHSHLGA